jgi:hypothetical protein
MAHFVLKRNKEDYLSLISYNADLWGMCIYAHKTYVHTKLNDLYDIMLIGVHTYTWNIQVTYSYDIMLIGIAYVCMRIRGTHI